MLSVKVYHEGECVQRVDLRSTDIIIGRDNTADIQLPSQAVSRRHARLVRDEDGWQISDLGAANGVYVSRGDEEPKRVVIEKLVDGDTILVEKFSIRIKEVDDSRQSQQFVLSEDEKQQVLDAEASRTQFISMVDVLDAGEGYTPPMSMDAEPPEETVPVPEGTWWVRMRSDAGHDRIFRLETPNALVGASDKCVVRLPSGPPELVELERTGESVSISRIARWPFPRVTVEDRAIKTEMLLDQNTFAVSDFEFQIHLQREPKKG